MAKGLLLIAKNKFYVKRLLHHIIRLALGFIPVVLIMASSMAQGPMLHLVVDQCETIEFSVVDMPGDRYIWDIYRDQTVDFAQVKGDVDPVAYFENAMYEGSTVRVNWLEPGRYFVKVETWDEEICTNNLKVFIIDVIESKPEAVLVGDSTCIGEPAVFKIVFTGKGPWDIQYTYGDDSNAVNLYGIVDPELTVPILTPLPIGETKFWVMEVTDQCTVNSYEADPQKVGVFIYPKPTNSKIYLKE